ncbi:hypothetical protein ON010_g17044 [Phytophthora cinnamomi]|nr:hypothetical protein ON010_g17044 [Phytophthora cinnamomi]
MVSTASLISATAIAVAGCLTTQVQGHGYMLIPLTEFKGGKTRGDWVVQIPPQFDANWDSVKYGPGLSAIYAKAAKEAGYTNIRKLLDSDTSLYGEDCGYSDPNAKPKNPPTDGTATFERGLAHPVRTNLRFLFFARSRTHI